MLAGGHVGRGGRDGGQVELVGSRVDGLGGAGCRGIGFSRCGADGVLRQRGDGFFGSLRAEFQAGDLALGGGLGNGCQNKSGFQTTSRVNRLNREREVMYR